MNKNIKLHIAFLNFNKEKFAILSIDKNLIEKTTADKVECFNSASNFFNLKNEISKYNTDLIIGVKKNKNIYSTVSEMLSKNEVLLVKNISCESDLLTYFEVISDKYEGEKEWIKYLNENKLGEIWVNGNLSLNIKNNYEEYSRDLGSRKKEEINKYDLNEYEKIWEFEELFNGKEKFVSGEYYRYWYSTKTKFVSLSM